MELDQLLAGNDNLIQQLPYDLLYDLVMKYLSPRDILRLCRVSKTFKQLICDDNAIWEALYRRDYSHHHHNNVDARYAYTQAYQQTMGGNQQQRLIAAARNGYEQLAHHLIQQGANVNLAVQPYRGPTPPGQPPLLLHVPNITPLQAAIDNGHSNVVQVLLDAGATIQPIHLLQAAEQPNPEIMRLLLQRKPNLDIPTGYGTYSTRPEHANIPIFQRQMEPTTFLSHVVVRSSPEVIREVLNTGVDVHANNEQALAESLKRNNYTITSMLIEAGADPKVLNQNLQDQVDKIFGAGPPPPPVKALYLPPMTVKQLQDELRKFNLKISGTKAELMQRLVDHYRNFNTKAIFPAEMAVNTRTQREQKPPAQPRPVSPTRLPRQQQQQQQLNFDKMTVVQLKDELRKRNLNVTGNKGELIQRLRENK